MNQKTKDKIVQYFVNFIKNEEIVVEDFEYIFFNVVEKYIKEYDKRKKRIDKTKIKQYSKLFDYQVSVLEFRKIPKVIIDKIKAIKKQVVEKAASLNIAEDNLPFIPVISQIRELLENKNSEVYLREKIWKDKPESLFENNIVYFIYNISLGGKMYLEENNNLVNEDELFCLQLQNIKINKEELLPCFQKLV